MFYRMKTRIRKHQFNKTCKGILETPPVAAVDEGPVILSEVSNADSLMYLVAVKSLCSRIGGGKVVLLLDRDCPQEIVRVYEEHVSPWKVFHVEDQVSPKCPAGGTWERILTIAQLVENDYVIQVDSDTVTNDSVPEVANHIASQSSFMIGTWSDQEIEPVAVSVERARESSSRHVQMLGEQQLTALKGADNLLYGRGQSSFAGFAKGSFSVAGLEDFSQQMEALLGKEKWAEWGSESFTSNFFVSNADRAAVLSWPKYASYNPERDADFAESAFIHFEGTNRFRNGAYIRSGQRVIERLLNLD